MKLLSLEWVSVVLFTYRSNAQKTVTLAEIGRQISIYQLSHEYAAVGGTAARPSTKCALACAFLNFAFPETISYPGSPIYISQEASYWSLQQAASVPICRFSPTSTINVSVGIWSLRVTECKFAVKSGGHGAFSGASNIDGGITIDLKHLNQLSISHDQAEITIGTGNIWSDVYDYLDPMGLTVVGGQVSDIGVGGLTLGGGISFFFWTFWVIFADGSINDVNRNTHPELYWALRGGGSNFGIVTQFDLFTIPQGNLWAGTITYLYSAELAERFNTAFYWLNINADPYAAIILVYVYLQLANIYLIVTDLQYTKPISNPIVFQNFTSIPANAQIANTMRITSLADVVAEFKASNPHGFRQSYWTLTVKNSPTLLTEITAIYMEEVNKIISIPDLVPSLVIQPITTAVTSQFHKNGGNALGFDDRDGPLNLIQLSISWSGTENDASIMSMARSIISQSNATAYAQNVGHPFIYQNYAAGEQAVFQSYGAKNLERLRGTSKKYEPDRVWQSLQPGHFKLF